MRKNDMLFFLERNADCAKDLGEYVKGEEDAALESLATALARKAYRLAREVAGEIHRGKSFTRLKVSRNKILYGSLKVRHKVEDLVVRFFAHRFPGFIIILESWRGCYIYGGQFKALVFTEEGLKNALEGLVGDSAKDEDSNPEKVWEEFYSSQYIPERENLRLFAKNMPKKFGTWETKNLQRTLGCKRLDEILDKERKPD